MDPIPRNKQHSVPLQKNPQFRLSLPYDHGLEDSEQLPAHWIMETTEDGSDIYYYNEITGEMRAEPPQAPPQLPQFLDSPVPSHQLALSDIDPFEPILENELDQDEPAPPAQHAEMTEDVLPPNWVKRTNHQGRVYYCNLVTQETTWHIEEIDPIDGHLMPMHNEQRNTTPTPSSRVDHDKDQHHNHESDDKPDDELTWATLAAHIASSIHNLNQCIKQGQDQWINKYTNQVINAIRTILLASGTIDKDSPYLRTNSTLRAYHRTMIASLSKVKLTAILCDAHRQQHQAAQQMSQQHLYPQAAASVGRPSLPAVAGPATSADPKNKLLAETNDLLVSVRNFVSTCQDIDVTLEKIDPHIIADGADEAPFSAVLSRRKTDQAKYALQPDLAENLDVYATNMHESIESITACLRDHAPVLPPSSRDAAEERYQFSTRVFAQFRNFSSQTGQFLGLLDDIDYGTVVDHELLEALARNKQRLSDGLGRLFCHLQGLTSLDEDLSKTLRLVDDHVQAIHQPIRTICDCITVMAELNERSMLKPVNGISVHPHQEHDSDVDNELLSPMRLPMPTEDDDDMHLDGSVFSRGMSYRTDLTEPSTKSMDLTAKKTKTLKKASIDTTASKKSSPGKTTSVVSASSHLLGSKESLAPPGPDIFNDEDNKSSTKLKKFFGQDVPPPSPTRKPTPSMAERPLFLGYDYDDSDVAFNMEGGVKGGTLAALVERLTLHDYLDMNFNNTFLLTYRSFCTSSDLLDLLEARYSLTPPTDLSEDDLEMWRQKKLKLVRLRVFNVLKNWLEIYYNEEDHVILGRLMAFTDTVIRSTLSFSTDQLERLIKKRMENVELDVGGLKKLVWTPQPMPQSILPRNPKKFKLLDLDAIELARQLTIMDFKMYSSIRPIECLDKAWSRDNDENGQPVAVNIRASIEYCNQVTSWVSDAILSQSDIKKRSNLIKFWVQVAERCRELNNFNTCMAILSAFDNSSVGRLKRTWEMVGARTNQILSHIRKIMGANRNFSEYRQLIHSVNPPCIPFLGIYLQDLTFIEDGNGNVIKGPNSHELINFAKREKTAEVIREIQQYQTLFYKLSSVEEIQEFIRLNLQSTRDEDQLYKESLKLEPREREDEKITRLLQESGFL
ncbi:ras GEF [Hesseltinella vesiculosa]|uniref:Ras GEF n=1 Tax=Hesseltinella vesiculosa TaxID=101127 RepID=A0A1X2GFJ9_9FUNG|nr:ras GEF [Hesseltinella vesiculosa]